MLIFHIRSWSFADRRCPVPSRRRSAPASLWIRSARPWPVWRKRWVSGQCYANVWCQASDVARLIFLSVSVCVCQPPVSSCDVLVVPVGQSCTSRAIKVTQKLWAAGVSSDIVYDVSQVSVHTLLGNFDCTNLKKQTNLLWLVSLSLFCIIMTLMWDSAAAVNLESFWNFHQPKPSELK